MLARINRKLKLDRIWTPAGGFVLFAILIAFFAWGITDANFRLIVFKPDNVPIVALIFLVAFFLWFSMKQARDNDLAIERGEKPSEALDNEKVLVWPDLVYVEFISLLERRVSDIVGKAGSQMSPVLLRSGRTLCL